MHDAIREPLVTRHGAACRAILVLEPRPRGRADGDRYNHHNYYCVTLDVHGRQLASATRTPGKRLASPTGPLPFGEATSPGATRPRDLRPPGPTRPRATSACAATSSAVPSFEQYVYSNTSILI
eukprot:scaffold40800_cov69-Phaeocystis_antarctica.AAC.9